jgi:hypothetical protein
MQHSVPLAVKIGFLDKIVDRLFDESPSLLAVSKDHRCNKPVESADELLPRLGVARCRALAHQFLD